WCTAFFQQSAGGRIGNKKAEEGWHMLRFIGAGMIFLALSACGIYLSENIKKKKERLVNQQKMLYEISDMIRWNSYTMHEIAAKLSESGSFGDFEFVKELGESCKKNRSFPEAWEKAVENDSDMSDEEKKYLIRIGADLGTTDKEGQLAAIEFFSAGLERMAQDQAEKYRVKGRMYRSLGIAAGAMIGIIII
ncbi:MAG: stage III sporulation protein AB, partial [Porcipelethomonas sp.]